jgi:MFS superfamily sulfate permease-like transporter
LYTGLKLIDIKAIRKLWDFGPRLVGIYAITTIAIVSTDLLVGVALGVVLSIFKLVYTMTRLKVSIDRIENKSILHLRGAATFLSLPVLADALDSVPANTELHVCMDELDYVDHACLELIMEWEQTHEATGGSLVMDWGELRAMFKSKRRTRSFRTASPAIASVVTPAVATQVHTHNSLARESTAV